MKRLVAISLAAMAIAGFGSGVRAEAVDVAKGDTEARSVSLAKIVIKVPRSFRWASLEAGPTCMAAGGETWDRVADQVAADDLERIFRREIQSAGLRVDGDPDNLFEQPASFGEYVVGGVVVGASGRFCFPSEVPMLTKLSERPASARGKGGATLDVEWQIYSRVQRRVVSKVLTKGGDLSLHSVAGRAEPLLDAFAENVRELITSQDFRQTFVDRPAKLENAVLLAPKQSLIQLPGATSTAPVDIADAISSVVLIFAGDGHGSGVLVSSDGYVLTDQHVIGAAKQVRVRWADGVESVGEVVRSDAARDVALIKTDPRGRDPLPLRLQSLRPGDTVYAIGAPLESRFQNSVTRGVVSAYRTIDGLRYLQSDVTVNPGNSGGPLLDEQGRVVGLTKSIYQRAEVPAGINFFVPSRDALDFLGAEAK